MRVGRGGCRAHHGCSSAAGAIAPALGVEHIVSAASPLCGRSRRGRLWNVTVGRVSASDGPCSTGRATDADFGSGLEGRRERGESGVRGEGASLFLSRRARGSRAWCSRSGGGPSRRVRVRLDFLGLLVLSSGDTRFTGGSCEKCRRSGRLVAGPRPPHRPAGTW